MKASKMEGKTKAELRELLAAAIRRTAKAKRKLKAIHAEGDKESKAHYDRFPVRPLHELDSPSWQHC